MLFLFRSGGGGAIGMVDFNLRQIAKYEISSSIKVSVKALAPLYYAKMPVGSALQPRVNSHSKQSFFNIIHPLYFQFALSHEASTISTV